MTPAQEAKEYADAHGFEIEMIAGKYHVTHALSGHSFVRSGYPAVLNEMRACASMLEMKELTPAQADNIDEFFDLALSPEDTALETAMLDARAAAFVMTVSDGDKVLMKIPLTDALEPDPLYSDEQKPIALSANDLGLFPLKSNAEIAADIMSTLSGVLTVETWEALTAANKLKCVRLASGATLDLIGQFIKLGPRLNNEPDQHYRKYLLYGTRAKTGVNVSLQDVIDRIVQQNPILRRSAVYGDLNAMPANASKLPGETDEEYLNHRAAAFGISRQPAAKAQFQCGWCAWVGARQYPRRDSRSEALTDVRRAFQGMGRNKPTAVIVHTSQFMGFV